MSFKGIGLIALVAAGTLAAPAAASTRKCQESGHVLARHGGAVLWSVTQKGSHGVRVTVYLCSPPKSGTHVGVSSGSSNLNPAVQTVKAAGDYLAFILTTGKNRYSSLFVYNVATGRKEVSVFDTCGHQLCGHDPHLSSYYLAANGWIAEVFTYPQGFASGSAPVPDYEALVATNSETVHYPIDLGYSISGESLSGGRLTWTSDLGGASSVALGSDLAPASPAQSLAACQVVTQSDVAPIMGAGAVSSSSSPATCNYSGAGKTLSISVQTGLSPSQMAGEEGSVQNAATASWPPDENYRVYESGGLVGPGASFEEQLWGFANGAAVTMQLTAPGPDVGENAAYLADVAYDRLFGIPVQRTS